MQDLLANPSHTDLAAENRRLVALLVNAGIDPVSGGRLSSGTSGDGTTVVVVAEAYDDRVKQDYAKVLLDAMSEGFYVIDPAGRTTVCNTAMLRLLGYGSAEEVIGISLHEAIHHSHADGSPYPAALCPIYRAAREGLSMVVDDEVFFRRDGTSFPVEYRTEPLYREGRLDGAVCTFVDISGRMASERQLKESQERLALAIQAGGIGIWDYTTAPRAMRCDDRVRALFGASPRRFMTIEEHRAAVYPDDWPRVDGAIKAALDPEGPGHFHVQFRTVGIEDAKVRWVEAEGQATFLGKVAVRLLGTLRDISGAKEADRHQRLLVNELNHRVMNSLAMVQGVASETFRPSTDIDAARASFMQRIVALARAHDVLTAVNWGSADLGHVVREVVGWQGPEQTARFAVEGPSLALSPKAALAFSIALHELATNAARYGALSAPGGTVSIRWHAEDDAPGARLHLEWTERGGPRVVAPKRRGYGTKLIERGLASELQGEVRIEFAQDGIICRINAPFPSGA